MSYNLLFTILSCDIGALINVALLICIPIASIVGFIIYKLLKIKLFFRIIISIIIGLLVAFISMVVFFKIIVNT
jgi:hypothetical protein